ncbi:carboxyl-terminal-processing peptidase 2, chloroplastic-like [Gossypium hirsutum]|uniref:Carboxyl-terminal-processing peptidase 2, chloroplastic-like n=1 Tax=Gossypium hirsutum TaxID=3635 RepID=A0A1U8P7G9_GOSHI|nr:carboxyl-terminal-processing peptidase 2, chloroplastic-like [Gossypium hirsutum]
MYQTDKQQKPQVYQTLQLHDRFISDDSHSSIGLPSDEEQDWGTENDMLLILCLFDTEDSADERKSSSPLEVPAYEYVYDAAERLQGPEGSSVELTVQTGPEIKHLALTQAKISLNPVKSRLCEVPGSEKNYPKIGYIKLTSFNQKASASVKEVINTLRSNSVNAFVLDLRDNRLDKGVIVYICDNHGVRDIYDTDGSSAIAASEPLAVLVNMDTASASEILTGALKDNKRAVLFGELTYGKGKIQSVFQLSDGSRLAVTVSHYETPANNNINKVYF